MKARTEAEREAILRKYAEGGLGTREAIAQAGLEDFADLLISLAQYELPLPKPADTPQRRASIAQAEALLQPRLRRNGH